MWTACGRRRRNSSPPCRPRTTSRTCSGISTTTKTPWSRTSPCPSLWTSTTCPSPCPISWARSSSCSTARPSPCTATSSGPAPRAWTSGPRPTASSRGRLWSATGCSTPLPRGGTAGGRILRRRCCPCSPPAFGPSATPGGRAFPSIPTLTAGCTTSPPPGAATATTTISPSPSS